MVRLVSLALAAAALAACDRVPEGLEPVPSPVAGRATVVPGQPPVVWVAGQSEGVFGDALTVVEREGTRLRLERLAGEATRFFEPAGGDGWRRMPEADVEAIVAGTPLCIEALAVGQGYLALRVFVGAACGPLR